MRYVDCTVTLRKETVEFKLPYSKRVEGELRYSEAARWAVGYLNQRVDQNEACEKDLLKLVGLHLYDILFGAPAVREAFEVAFEDFARESARGRATLARGRAADLRFRLKLVFEDPASPLAQLPWEFLFVPTTSSSPRGALAQRGFFFAGQMDDLVLTRSLSGEEPEFDPLAEQLRLLAVCCQPRGLDDIEKMALATIEDIRASGDRTKNVLVKRVEDPTFDNVAHDITAWKPHALHFVGHGEEGRLAFLRGADEPDPERDKNPRANPRRGAKWIGSDEIGSLFRDWRPLLVFLHACKSATAGATRSVMGLMDMARTIAVDAEVPIVVAMQYAIGSEDAMVFTKAFYAQVAAGQEVDEAMTIARCELYRAGASTNYRRFGTPIAYLRRRGALLPPPPAPEKKEEVPPTGTPPSSSTMRPGAAPTAIPDGVRMTSVAAAGPAPAAPVPAGPRPQDAPATVDQFDSRS